MNSSSFIVDLLLLAIAAVALYFFISKVNKEDKKRAHH